MHPRPRYFAVLWLVWLPLFWSLPVPAVWAQPSPPPYPSQSNQASEHTVQPGESLWAIASRYDVSIPELMKLNLLHGPTGIFPGDRLRIPRRPAAGKSEPLPFLDLATSDARQSSAAGKLIWPIEAVPISQGYHSNHHGIDLSVEIGNPVHAAATGEVIRVDSHHPIYGQLVVIDHGNQIITLYAHLSQTAVLEGYIVLQGEVIGASGNSGRSSGPHLHFELRHDGRFVNPCDYLKGPCR